MRVSQRLAVWTIASAAACVVTAASADDFYKGKTVKLIIGSGEASGVDILGRVAARQVAVSAAMLERICMLRGEQRVAVTVSCNSKDRG